MQQDEAKDASDVEITPTNTREQYAPINTHEPEKGGVAVINGYHSNEDAGIHSKVQLLDYDPSKLESNEEDTDDEPEDGKAKAKRIAALVLRILTLIGLLYIFICSLNLLSDGFTLLGGRAAGSAFQNSALLRNPVCGLMIGVVCTAFLQSSSTSTSIIITMVAAGLFDVRMSIPIIMGANIGTSVTGILVAVTQAGDREVFRRAFGAATVHDMFNWLTVITLLPLEVATGYLYHLTSVIVAAAGIEGGGSKTEFLSVITKPFTNFLVQVDKDALNRIAAGEPNADELSLLKYWCEYGIVANNATAPPYTENSTAIPDVDPTMVVGVKECWYIFHGTALSEAVVGAIVLFIALVFLITALIFMVKILKSLLQGSMAKVIKKTINADFPGRAACLTGYVAILVGAVVTILVQSSSVVASALTPLVGIGVVTVERVFPMMLGANIGTTSTAILASFAASSDRVAASFQIALCHLFFNLSGILIWYPIPPMRKVPISLAKFLGKVTSRYRWFAFLYLLCMFFAVPMGVFGLSILGWQYITAVLVLVGLLLTIIGVINLLQKHKAHLLPAWLQTWEFLPECLRSLAPLDRLIQRTCTCKFCRDNDSTNSEDDDDDGEGEDDEKDMNGIEKMDGTADSSLKKKTNISCLSSQWCASNKSVNSWYLCYMRVLEWNKR